MTHFRNLRLVALALALLPAAASAQTPLDLVDTLIGTAGAGQTYPSVGAPFAMTQWSPETRLGEEKCIAPYYFTDTKLLGFRASHFMPGSCVQDYGSLSLLPGTGPLGNLSATLSHTAETHTPYLYATTLPQLGVSVEMTGGLRSGIFRLHYLNSTEPWLLVRSGARNQLGTVLPGTNPSELIIRSPVTRIYAGQGKLAGTSGYFVLQADHTFHLAPATTPTTQRIIFDNVKSNEPVLVKIGSSFTSFDEARNNLTLELPAFDFDALAQRTKAAWETSLAQIDIPGASPDRTVFYTALYHSMQVPHTFSDASGTYPHFASGHPIEHTQNFTMYMDYSIWDTFRALHPLLTLIDPHRERDMVLSLMAMGDQGGRLPIYPAWNSYTSEMIGDHADAVIEDALTKHLPGLTPADTEHAYTLMRRNALDKISPELYADGAGRRGFHSYLQYGYIPLEDQILDAYHPREQVSRTLEYAYDDFLVGQLAHTLHHDADATLFARRALNYRNIIDPTTGFARGRHADGTWDTPFSPSGNYKYITEGLPFQYTFFVPQDVPGLIQYVGGNDAFNRKLDALFGGHFYDHGNEPSHHIAFLYNFSGEAWMSQFRVNNILKTKYSALPTGIPGNDDAGQMSAWYVLASMGLYQVTPGIPTFQIVTPHFDQTTLKLPSGRAFIISAPGAEQGKLYIQSATLNGKPLTRSSIEYDEIMAGGTLTFALSKTPNKSWPQNQENRTDAPLLLH